MIERLKEILFQTGMHLSIAKQRVKKQKKLGCESWQTG